MQTPKENTSGHSPYEQELAYWKKNFRALTDDELIRTFNSSTRIRAWNRSRAAQCNALIHEFERRGWDYSVLGDRYRFSLKTCVVLRNTSLFRFTQLPLDEAFALLVKHLADVCQAHPAIHLIEYNDERIAYRLDVSDPVCIVSLKDLLLNR
jgi:hypothetical protein